MKLLIFITIFLYSSCLTKKYYKNCLDEVESVSFPSVDECAKFSSNDSFCCYLYSEKYESSSQTHTYTVGYYTYTYYYYYYDKKDNETKKRSLYDTQRFCYGISQKGFENIGDVIDELSEETGMENLRIDCGDKSLNYGLLKEFILLLIFILL